MTNPLLNRRIFLKGAAALTSLAGASVWFGQRSIPLTKAATRPLQVASTRDLGAVGKPSAVMARDGGSTAIIGGQLLWMFGDTIVTDGKDSRSNTAALADPRNPLAVHEALDANGNPSQFVPFTPEEQAYNDSTGKPDDRIAIWPAGVINYRGQGLVFSMKMHILSGFLNFQSMGVALALVERGQTVATRLPGLLFTYPEPDFANTAVYNGMVYVFGGSHNKGIGNGAVVAARAPLGSATERAAYRFWNGSDWVADVNQVTPMFTEIPGAPTVSYNPYLGQFLATNSEPFSSNIVMRVAPSTSGPWSNPVVVYSGLLASSGSFDYVAIEHPELARNGGRTVSISYFHPTGTLLGDVRLVEVNFQ